MTTRQDFPKGFCFGAATAAYQIEGAVAEDGRLPSIWDTFSHTPGKVKRGDTGDVACDHYHLWRSDLDLVKALGLDAYRFSVAWPRIIPTGRGKTNDAGLDFYERLVDGLLERGIEPFLTLYHWDLPQALQDLGGWTARDTAYAFCDYARVVAKRLGDRVRKWATHNEPWCSAFLGHLFGSHAPGMRDLEATVRASHNLLLAHGLAMKTLRELLPKSELGIVLNLSPMHPATDAPADVAAAARADGGLNRWFLDPLYGRGYPRDVMAAHQAEAPSLSNLVQDGDLELIAAPTDFLGINYYHRGVVRHDEHGGPGQMGFVKVEGERTDFGWEVYPDGLRELLVRVAREYHPKNIYVTENGAYYKDEVGKDGEVEDEPRRSYIERHLEACREAIAEGAPLRGYFVWSLLDNFEWAEGYEPRFGVVHVDFATKKRTIKASGHWLRRVAEDT